MHVAKTVSVAVVFILTSFVATAVAQDGDGPPRGPEGLGVADLVGEILDLDAMTRRPDPIYEIESHFPKPGTSVPLRVDTKGDRKEYVVAEGKGPGAITSIWLEKAVGSLRLYFDGSPLASVDLDSTLIRRDQVRIFHGAFSAATGAGVEIRFPMPYAKSFKLTVDEAPGCFRVVTRRYPEKTMVRTFVMKDAMVATFMMPDAATKPAGPAEWRLPEPESSILPPPTGIIECAAGRESVIWRDDTRAPQAIRFLALDDITSGNAKEIWERCRLVLEFDGERTVDMSMGEFFGPVPEFLPYEIHTTGQRQLIGPVRWCAWPMPYRKSVVVRVKNPTRTAIKHIRVTIATSNYEWTDTSMLFAAKSTAGGRIDLRGPGRLVGETATMTGRGWTGRERVLPDGATSAPFVSTRVRFGATGDTPFAMPFGATGRFLPDRDWFVSFSRPRIGVLRQVVAIGTHRRVEEDAGLDAPYRMVLPCAEAAVTPSIAITPRRTW